MPGRTRNIIFSYYIRLRERTHLFLGPLWCVADFSRVLIVFVIIVFAVGVVVVVIVCTASLAKDASSLAFRKYDETSRVHVSHLHGYLLNLLRLRNSFGFYDVDGDLVDEALSLLHREHVAVGQRPHNVLRQNCKASRFTSQPDRNQQ